MDRSKIRPVLPRGLWHGFLSCLGILGLGLSNDAWAQVQIHLKPEVQVNHRTLRLGDIASIQGSDPRSRDWAGLDLAQLTALSQQVPISAQSIHFRLLLAGMAPGDFRLEGASRCLVTLEKFELLREDLADLVRTDLAKKRGLAPEKLEVTLLQTGELPRRRFHAREEVSFTVWESEMSTPTRRTNPGDPLLPREFVVRVLAHGREEAQVGLIATVQRWDQVNEVARDLPSGTLLTASDAPLMRRLVPLEWAGNPAMDASWFDGKTTLRPLSRGQVLTPTDISSVKTVKESPILIKQRDLVKITARVGVFLIHTNGEAMQDGRQGDLIRVRNLDSKSVVLTRVQDKGAVQLEY